MPVATEVSALFASMATVVAAFVAGAFSLSNLIVSKESKVSEFRQAWIDCLRDELTTLFKSTRMMVRAVQEDRNPVGGENARKYRFPEEKIVETRSEAAEMHHKIRLRLNAGQADHYELIRLLAAMMTAQQKYLDNEISADHVVNCIERASEQAAAVLKREWETVKLGEPAYRKAVSNSKWILGVAGFLVVALVVWTAVQASSPQAKERRSEASFNTALQALRLGNVRPPDVRRQSSAP